MTRISTRPFVRSHGHEPRGEGRWAFQASSTDVAYAADLSGDIFWHTGPYAEARGEAHNHFTFHANAPVVVAVLP